MRASSRHAFKEWASVCGAVAAGRQAILLRKGGIHERRGRFAVEQEEFWLFATRFHQSDEELSPDGRRFLVEARTTQPADGSIALPAYVVATDVLSLEREDLLPRLQPYHVYADQVLVDRFRYKRPGLTLIVVRAFTPREPMMVPDSAQFAGCRSWVELASDLPTAGLRPVIDDAVFDELRKKIFAVVGS